jgi:pimeloyl-ACP methyl ester carboxylesterase
MRSGNREKGLEAHRPLVGFADPKAHVFASPSAFAGRDWLSAEALSATEALIDSLLRRYPIDSADIRMVGVSDGTLAVIRYGLSGRRPVRAKILVSALPQLALPQEALVSTPRLDEGRWDILQGGRDRLFPAQAVFPYLEAWHRLHPNAHIHLYPEGEHDFGWYAVETAPLLRELLATQKTQKGRALQKGPKKT